MNRFVSAALVASLLAPSLPAFAQEVEAPKELPCQDTSDRAHARCITDALKAWKSLEHEYNKQEKAEVAAWKKEHADMGVGADYQKALREFLADVRARRKEFETQLNEFRKAFFDEQKAKRAVGDGRKATEKKLEKADLDAADAVCGTPDDDGEYRICMRIQLRKKAANVDRRSRTNSRVIHD